MQVLLKGYAHYIAFTCGMNLFPVAFIQINL